MRIFQPVYSILFLRDWTTVAHRGKTELNFPSRTQQLFWERLLCSGKCYCVLENIVVFWRGNWVVFCPCGPPYWTLLQDPPRTLSLRRIKGARWLMDIFDAGKWKPHCDWFIRRKKCVLVWSSHVGTGSVAWLRPQRLRRRLTKNIIS